MNIFYIKFCFKISCRLSINFKLPVQRSKSVLSLNVCQWLRRFLVTRSIFTSSILQLTLTITALFINTRILKFKSQPTFAFLLPSIIFRGVLGNRRFFNEFKRSSFVICKWWSLIHFVCFCVSRFVAYDRNYD